MINFSQVQCVFSDLSANNMVTFLSRQLFIEKYCICYIYIFKITYWRVLGIIETIPKTKQLIAFLYEIALLRYLTPEFGCIKNFSRSISLKSTGIDKTYFKNKKKKVNQCSFL